MQARWRLKAAGCERVYSERASPGADSRSLPRARARRVRFGPPDRLSPLGEVYLQPTLTTGHWTGEGGSRQVQPFSPLDLMRESLQVGRDGREVDTNPICAFASTPLSFSFRAQAPSYPQA